MMNWIEYSIQTYTEAIEIISGVLISLDIKGISVEDNNYLKLDKEEKSWDYVDEKAIFNNDYTIIKFYLLESDDKIELIKNKIKEYEKNEKIKLVYSIDQKIVKEEEWANNWKKYFKPIKITDNIVIKPTWEDIQTDENKLVIDIDPGMAFGTGTHETTAMCIKLIEEYLDKNKDIVFDIGCGSGILSIISAKLGAKKVIGVDIDEAAIKVSKENIIKNNCENIVRIIKGDLLDKVEEKADIIVANIIAEVITDMIPSLEKYLKSNGTFISSGIIKEKEDIVISALNKHNYKIIDKKCDNGWVAFVAKLNKGE